jgi:hypothetical protein
VHRQRSSQSDCLATCPGLPARHKVASPPTAATAPSPQLLDRAASAQVRIEAARQAAELSARHHLDLAASTFEILKGIFGNKGPCAMPREQVRRGGL